MPTHGCVVPFEFAAAAADFQLLFQNDAGLPLIFCHFFQLCAYFWIQMLWCSSNILCMYVVAINQIHRGIHFEVRILTFRCLHVNQVCKLALWSMGCKSMQPGMCRTLVNSLQSSLCCTEPLVFTENSLPLTSYLNAHINQKRSGQYHQWSQERNSSYPKAGGYKL